MLVLQRPDLDSVRARATRMTTTTITTNKEGDSLLAAYCLCPVVAGLLDSFDWLFVLGSDTQFRQRKSAQARMKAISLAL